MINEKNNGLKRLERLLNEAPSRSPFSAYLRENFDAFEKVISGIAVIGRWPRVAQWAMDEGLTAGRPLTPATAKRAYERERARRGKPGKDAPRVDQAIVPQVRAEPVPEGDENEAPVFRPVRKK